MTHPDLAAWLRRHRDEADVLNLERRAVQELQRELQRLHQSNDRMRKQNNKLRKRVARFKGADGDDGDDGESTP